MLLFSLISTLLIASDFLVKSDEDVPSERLHPGIKMYTGNLAQANSLPYQLIFALVAETDIACGASLVHPKYALTSAHCTAGSVPSDIEIMAGIHNIDEDEDHVQTRKVVRIIDHEDYHGESDHFQNDISLLELDEPIEINQWVKVINMAPKDFLPTGSALVSGWGTVNKTEEKMTADLRRIVVPLVNASECAAAYARLNLSITEKQICAGYIGQEDNDPCRGDSGGPLIVTVRGKFIQIGIVSLGKSCAKKTYPAVFTKVAAYRSWIDPKII